MLSNRPQIDGVTFRAPLAQWAFGALRVLLVFMLLLTVLGAALAVLAMLTVPPNAQGPPAWLIGAGLLLPLVSFVSAVRLGRNDLRRRIVLGVDSLWIGGMLFGSIVPYESVRLVRMAYPRKTVGQVHQVVIERGGRRRASIWLKQRDAEECFAALRDFCDRAAAVGKHEELYGPRDTEYEAEATLVLAASLRRRAFRAALLCALILLWWGVMVLGLILGGGRSSSGGSPRGPWHLLAMLPIVAFGMAASAIRDRREAKRHVAGVRIKETSA